MTVREIQQHLTEMYGTEVSATLISTVTDAVIDEVKQWQSRPLDSVYPIVYLDCIHDEAVMKLFYLALRNISQKWTMPLRDLKPALNKFTIQF